MRRAFSLLLTMTALLLGFRLLAACLDITPIIVEHEAASATNGSCLACLKQPDICKGLLDQCNADRRCAPVFACMEVAACLEAPTLDAKINCTLPCAADAGIQSTSDPVVSTYLVGLVACATQKCAGPCNLSDGGVGL